MSLGAAVRARASAMRTGACRVVVALALALPLAILGRFPFHCHILAHEDKGMMAKILIK